MDERLELNSPKLKDYELIKIFDYHLKIISELQKTVKVWESLINYACRCDVHETAKRERRAAEFRVRFARNHLYPLRTETRAIEKISKHAKPELILRVVTKAYQLAVNALVTYNAYAFGPENFPVLDKIKECITDVKQLRDVTRHILNPIEETLGNNNDQYEVLCLKIAEIPEPVKTTQTKKKKKRKPVPAHVPSQFGMYEPKLTNWMKNSKQLAKNTKKVDERLSTVGDVSPAKNIHSTKMSKKPVSCDGDVETAVCAYDSTRLKQLVLEACNIQSKQESTVQTTETIPKNIGLFCVMSEKEPIMQPVLIPPVVEKTSRILKIEPEILDKFHRFKIDISEDYGTEPAKLISRICDDVLTDIFEEIADRLMDDDFLEQMASEEFSQLQNTVIG